MSGEEWSGIHYSINLSLTASDHLTSIEVVSLVDKILVYKVQTDCQDKAEYQIVE